MDVVVTCSCCGGTGQVKLTGVFADTLRMLRANPGLCGADLARLVGCKGPAMANRLAWLKAKGLAVSRQYGRRLFWHAVEDWG